MDRRDFIRQGSLYVLGAAIVAPYVRKYWPVGIDLRQPREETVDYAELWRDKAPTVRWTVTINGKNYNVVDSYGGVATLDRLFTQAPATGDVLCIPIS